MFRDQNRINFETIWFDLSACGVHDTQVPESVVDARSTAYNRGRVSIHGANEAAAAAYRKQFQTDLAGFLRARAHELKRGGSMFLVCLGRTSLDPADQGGAGLLFGTHFQDAWDDLVQEVPYISKYYLTIFFFLILSFFSFLEFLCVNLIWGYLRKKKFM